MADDLNLQPIETGHAMIDDHLCLTANGNWSRKFDN